MAAKISYFFLRDPGKIKRRTWDLINFFLTVIELVMNLFI